MDNKKIFAENLKKQMELKEKSRKDISEALGISYYTVTDWVTGKKYPRMDKVEMLADYFGILKSDLIEEKTEKELQTAEKNNALADIIVKMRTDDDFLSIVKLIYSLDENQIKAVKQMLNAFIK
jgi:repressor LexA